MILVCANIVTRPSISVKNPTFPTPISVMPVISSDTEITDFLSSFVTSS